MKKNILFLSITIATGLLFTNLYSSLVDARSWGNDIPNSIGAAREYFKVANPGNFFRIFSPINQALGLVCLVIFWKTSPSIRISLAIALVLYLAAEGLTFGYFFPRNEILFKSASLTDVETLKKVWSEWNSMNWVRTSILIIGVYFSYYSLNKIYLLKDLN